MSKEKDRIIKKIILRSYNGGIEAARNLLRKEEELTIVNRDLLEKISKLSKLYWG